jgi:hypothetical protein
MKRNTPFEREAISLHYKAFKRRPILYGQAVKNRAVIDVNNSIALLRDKWKGDKGVYFQSVRG